MPLSSNEQTNKTAGELVDKIRSIFGTPQDKRPAHARGHMAKGTFTPSKEAAALSMAQIFHQPSTPLVLRFSSATGIASIPDSSPDAIPRGLAVRFVLSEDGHKHYDIISHSKNGFMVRTGEEFLEMLEALTSGKAGEFFAEHPFAKEFNDYFPGFPKSVATEQFFGVHAFKFSNDQGNQVYFRYRIVPKDGPVEHISKEEAEAKGQDYLYEELANRLGSPGGGVKYQLLAQIAEEGDVTDDATKVWPESRQFIPMGVIDVNQAWDEATDGQEQKQIIFDPVPRQIEGIETGEDPLIDMRATVYLISGKKRRAAGSVA